MVGSSVTVRVWRYAGAPASGGRCNRAPGRRRGVWGEHPTRARAPTENWEVRSTAFACRLRAVMDAPTVVDVRAAIVRQDWSGAQELADAAAPDRRGRRGRARRPAGRGALVVGSGRRLHRRTRARVPRLPGARAHARGRAVRGMAVGAPRHQRAAGDRGCVAATGPQRAGRRGRGRRVRRVAAAGGGDGRRRATAHRRARARDRGHRTGAGARLGQPRGRGAADQGPHPDRDRADDRGDAPPRRGDAVRRRGPARPVLHRQGVLQPHHRV